MMNFYGLKSIDQNNRGLCPSRIHIKQTFFDIKDEIPNMILTGTAGTGKTTIANHYVKCIIVIIS